MIEHKNSKIILWLHLKSVTHEPEMEKPVSQCNHKCDHRKVQELAKYEPAKIDVVSGNRLNINHFNFLL